MDENEREILKDIIANYKQDCGMNLEDYIVTEIDRVKSIERKIQSVHDKQKRLDEVYKVNKKNLDINIKTIQDKCDHISWEDRMGCGYDRSPSVCRVCGKYDE